MARKRRGVCIPDADGYQWGVRFSDGSTAHGWNGATQLDRCQEFIYRCRKQYGWRGLTLVRRTVTEGKNCWVRGEWEHVDIDPWRKPLTNSIRVKGSEFTTPYGWPVRGWVWRGHYLARILTSQANSRLRVKLIKGEHQ